MGRAVAILTALVLTGCGSSVPSAGDAGFDPDPVGAPVTLLPAPAPEATPEPAQDSADGPGATPEVVAPAEDGAERPPPADAAPDEDPSPAQAPVSPAGFRVVGALDDRAGDAGLEAPPYADIVQVIVEDADGMARLTVALAGDLPAPLADGEVMGIGVDIYSEPGGESDYQVFASGNADGWSAYLQTATGLFSLPGSAGIGEQRIVFELDWSYLGQFPRGEFGAFVDWSRRRAVINAAGGDRAPDRGTAAFRR